MEVSVVYRFRIAFARWRAAIRLCAFHGDGYRDNRRRHKCAGDIGYANRPQPDTIRICHAARSQAIAGGRWIGPQAARRRRLCISHIPHDAAPLTASRSFWLRSFCRCSQPAADRAADRPRLAPQSRCSGAELPRFASRSGERFTPHVPLRNLEQASPPPRGRKSDQFNPVPLVRRSYRARASPVYATRQDGIRRLRPIKPGPRAARYPDKTTCRASVSIRSRVQ